MSYYRYATLDPRPTEQARQHNEQIFAAGPVYGLEVTVPALAARCVTNLDPQHLGGDASTAAVEAAVDWKLPPPGAILATVRADADSVGAMAVLLLRATGTPPVSAGVSAIQAIADADKEATGPWPGIRPAASAEDLVGPATPIMHLAADHGRGLGERVELLAEWIKTGADSPVGDLLADYRERALMEAQDALDHLDVQTLGPVAVVTGSHRLAMAIGYRYAPVVVATNPDFQWQGGPRHVKHTVARWNSSTVPGMDWAVMLDQLNAADPAVAGQARWGGSTSICGSPQGIGSGLSTGQVAELAAGLIATVTVDGVAIPVHGARYGELENLPDPQAGAAYVVPLMMDDITKRWAIGTVRMLNPERGFGFIRPEGGGEDVHFRVTAYKMITWRDTGAVCDHPAYLAREPAPPLHVGMRVAYRMREVESMDGTKWLQVGARPTCATVTPAHRLEQARQVRAEYVAAHPPCGHRLAPAPRDPADQKFLDEFLVRDINSIFSPEEDD